MEVVIGVAAVQTRLEALRARLWREVDAPRLAEVLARAQFEDSPVAERLRRYEGGHARDLHRCLSALERRE
ncbi:MAG: hypothetical protein IRY99_23585, partial [Isosphaeraceae bacterium]|nr:hypothetical protein [Isosphaeraceae bacterium]